MCFPETTFFRFDKQIFICHDRMQKSSKGNTVALGRSSVVSVKARKVHENLDKGGREDRPSVHPSLDSS